MDQLIIVKCSGGESIEYIAANIRIHPHASTQIERSQQALRKREKSESVGATLVGGKNILVSITCKNYWSEEKDGEMRIVWSLQLLHRTTSCGLAVNRAPGFAATAAKRASWLSSRGNHACDLSTSCHQIPSIVVVSVPEPPRKFLSVEVSPVETEADVTTSSATSAAVQAVVSPPPARVLQWKAAVSMEYETLAGHHHHLHHHHLHHHQVDMAESAVSHHSEKMAGTASTSTGASTSISTVTNFPGGSLSPPPNTQVTLSASSPQASDPINNNGQTGTSGISVEETPNHIVYRKMEGIIERMQDEQLGVPVRTVKSFMSKIPSVFTGADLTVWMIKNLDVEDQIEALHLAHLMSAHGYFFPIDDHILTVKNDGTFYRFQTPYFWPSNCWEPENTDYAVYLCKRTMQNKTRLELADYEAENLARLQKMFSRKWEFIFMQAEAQSKVDKKRDKLERKVLDSQERAFWDVHRPVPGCVNTTEIDIKKACRMNKPIKSSKHMQCAISGGRISPSVSQEDLSDPTLGIHKEIEGLKQKLDRRNVKISKVSESYINYFEQYQEYDPFLTTPEPTNPWISDNVEYWEQEKQANKEISSRRVRRWAFSLLELLKDSVGREQFVKFLDKEFSGENLKFWEAVQELKSLPAKDVISKVQEIWQEYLAPDANVPVNIDSKSTEITKKNMENPDRWTFDEAVAHVYHLMKSDSYSRYLRSELYKDFLSGSKKKTSVKGIRSVISFPGRKEQGTT
ncbi:Regulator of G-protein signaling 7 [Chamberlinius hualienensis]